MAKTKVLLAGESWMSSSVHHKGFDSFSSTTFHLGAGPLVEALKDSPFELTYMPAHEATEDFPFDVDALSRFGAVILSDIGANSLLLPQDVWLRGLPRPNRLKVIRQWVEGGGGLVMVGGYLTFQGIDGKGRWRGTPVEAALPACCLPYDDRIEAPEGFRPEIVDSNHPVTAGMPSDWPVLLGANEVVLRDDATLLAKLPDEFGGHPLLATRQYGRGRTAIWTSDVGPHWLPDSFSAWEGYPTLWRNILGWVSDSQP